MTEIYITFKEENCQEKICEQASEVTDLTHVIVTVTATKSLMGILDFKMLPVKDNKIDDFTFLGQLCLSFEKRKCLLLCL